jgi:hypothetical protein
MIWSVSADVFRCGQRVARWGAGLTGLTTAAVIGFCAAIPFALGISVGVAAAGPPGSPIGPVTLNPSGGTAMMVAGQRGPHDTVVTLSVAIKDSVCSGNKSSNPPFAAALYIAGTDVDLTAVDFGSLNPSGSGDHFLSTLYDVGFRSQDRLSPGSAPVFAIGGTAVSLWGLADSPGLTDGTYRIGLVCYNNSTMTLDRGPVGGAARYWESTITISKHVTGNGSGTLTWALRNAPGAPTTIGPGGSPAPTVGTPTSAGEPSAGSTSTTPAPDAGAGTTSPVTTAEAVTATNTPTSLAGLLTTVSGPLTSKSGGSGSGGLVAVTVGALIAASLALIWWIRRRTRI